MKLSKEERSWVLYDWANSSFATTVMAGFFPLFFQKFWSAGQDPIDSTSRLGIILSVSGLVATLLTLLFGPYSDRYGKRKVITLLAGFIGVLGTFGLMFFGEGEWLGPLLLYGLALMGFTLSCNFYDSLLPQVVQTPDEKQTNWVSSLGYGFGYLGGGILFTLNVLVFLNYEALGIASAANAVKISFVTVAIWWTFFSVPFIKNVKENAKVIDESNRQIGIKEFLKLLGMAWKNKRIFYFLLAFWFYIDGIYTVMTMAVDFGTGIGLEGKHLMGALLMTQFVAFPFTILSSKLANRWGPEKSLILLISIYIVAVIAATQMTTAFEFFVLAFLIGVAQGGVQAISRSLFAILIPKSESGKWYALMNVVGRFAAIIGPLLVGIVTQITDSHRWGVGSITLLLAIGIYFLLKSSKVGSFALNSSRH